MSDSLTEKSESEIGGLTVPLQAPVVCGEWELESCPRVGAK